MAENPEAPADPFDVKRIHYLVRLMNHYGLTELDLSNGSAQIRLKRPGADLIATAAPAAPAPAASPAPSANPSAPARQDGADAPPPSSAPAQKTIVIESPMVGTYYTSSAPESPPYVTHGSVVHPETIIGIIEAMKVFTEIPAGVSGTIVEVLAKNGQAVEFGQPLFRLVPA